jgi:hypothetical protein
MGTVESRSGVLATLSRIAARVLPFISLVPIVHAGSLQAKLVNGVIRYTGEDGKRQRVDVGKRCRDLWIAPDETVFAFIAIERSRGFEDGGEPFVVKSTIYIARKTEHFVPERVAVTSVRIENADWEVFRFPSVSPDGALVLFYVPTGTAFAHNRNTKKNEPIGRAWDYCSAWDGPYAGSVLIQERNFIPHPSSPQGPFYDFRCYRKAPGKGETPDSCAEFDPDLRPGSNITFVMATGAACTEAPR